MKKYIYDLDNTLVYSNYLNNYSYNYALKVKGIHPVNGYERITRDVIIKKYPELDDKLLNETIELYNSVKHITNSFDYAAKVKAHPLCGVLFSIKSGNIASIEDGIRKTDINKLNKIIKSY